MASNAAQGSVFVCGGAATGALVSVNLGGMGLSFSGTAIGLGFIPVTAAGAITGAASYGAFKAIVKGDAAAISAAVSGGLGGAGISLTIGGMGLAFKGTAISLGLAPITAAGAVVGLAIYGILDMLNGTGIKEDPLQVFNRVEENISWQETYHQALIDLNQTFIEYRLENDFSELESEAELNALKQSILKENLLLSTIKSGLESDIIYLDQTWKLDTKFVELNGINFEFNEGDRLSQNTSGCTSSGALNHEDQHQTSTLARQTPFSWEVIYQLPNVVASNNGVAISPDGHILATSHSHGTVNLWNMKTGKFLYNFIGEAKEIAAVTFCPEGQVFISCGFDRKITAWQLHTKQFIRTFFDSNTPYSHDGFVHGVAFTPNGKTLVSGGGDRKIKIWDAQTGRIIRILSGHMGSILAIAIDPAGEFLVSGSEDQTLKIWQIKNGRCLHTFRGHSGSVFSASVTPDGTTIVSGSGDGTLKLWNAQTGEQIRTLSDSSAPILSIAISPDGSTVASASRSEVKLWSLLTGERLHSLAGCYPVTFSPEGRVLVTGSSAGAAKLWRQTCNPLKVTQDLVLDGEWWEVLGIAQNACRADVEAAYRRLARLYHPDINPSPLAEEMMPLINRAFQNFKMRGPGPI